MLVLALGSNLGDRLQNLKTACDKLEDIFGNITKSNIYEADAMVPDGAPESWKLPFYNMVTSVKTNMPALKILKKIQKIEIALGREKEHEYWSPRTIDIDIVAYGDKQQNDEQLSIPHIELLKRPFFLWPMADIASEWQYPIKNKYFGKTTIQLARNLHEDYPLAENIYHPMLKIKKTRLTA